MQPPERYKVYGLVIGKRRICGLDKQNQYHDVGGALRFVTSTPSNFDLWNRLSTFVLVYFAVQEEG